MDALIEATLTHNGGFIGRSEPMDLGCCHREIRDLVAGRQLVRIRRGYYASSAVWSSLRPEERHVVKVRMAARRFGSGVAICGASAQAVRRRALWHQDLDTINVVRLDGRSGRTDTDVRHHVTTIDPEREIRDRRRSAARPRIARSVGSGMWRDGRGCAGDARQRAT